MKTTLVGALVLALAVPAAARADGDIAKMRQKVEAEAKAAENQKTQEAQAKATAVQNTDAAKEDVDVAGLDLQAAKLFVSGLYDLSSRKTFERQHTTALFNRAQDAVTQAEEQVGALQKRPQAKAKDAAEPLDRARSTLVTVQSELRAVAGDIRSGGNNSGRIQELYKKLDSASHDVESAAKAMGVDARINMP